jgi:hypothetical protein
MGVVNEIPLWSLLYLNRHLLGIVLGKTEGLRMSIAEQWAAHGTITWVPTVAFFLLAALFYAWGHQWHMTVYILAFVIGGLGIMEGISVLQTGHTITQNEAVWAASSVRNYIFSFAASASLVLAITSLALHFK